MLKFYYTENNVNFIYDEPERCEDIRSIKGSAVITESHFEQEFNIKGIALIKSKYRSTNFRL